MEREKLSKSDLKSLPDAGRKYKLGLKIGGGVGGEVHEAVDRDTGKKVAIKIQQLTKETEDEIRQEHSVLKEFSSHGNFPEFYGIFLNKGKDNIQRIWQVIEFCDGGTANDISRKLVQENKKMEESHIAYIMRETIKAVIYLHEKGICHRDIRGSNILLTDDARVKLIDFGTSCDDKSNNMKKCIGSPSWMAPEVIACQTLEEVAGYDKKVDVWALGITAIELGDGLGPLEDMHPGRVLSHIVQNPPPTLRKPSDWSQMYNDFVSECLVKNPENRPYAQELLAHTFFECIDQNKSLQSDLQTLLQSQKELTLYKNPDVQIRQNYMKIEQQPVLEKILQEDLAALSDVSEDSVLSELHERFKKNDFQTFIGDILLILNPNKNLDIYGNQHHKKYHFKAKSQNAPHIYAMAESAYRDAFHHEKPQHLIFSGETGAGKTVNAMHAVDHLLFLGQGLKSSEKIKKALNVIHTMGNADTPHNSNSTRHILQSQITFTDTGKASGAVFRIFQLEKGRVTTSLKKQNNFHVFYYFYDAVKSDGDLAQYHLEEDRQYQYLKTGLDSDSSKNSIQNADEFRKFENTLRELEFEDEQILSIKNILAAILLIGEITFVDDDNGIGVISTADIVTSVANLLGVDKKKLSWALLNYCVIMKGEAVMRHNSKAEADEAKNVLARGIYSRLVDWITIIINEKLSVPRVIYGDKYIISLLDLYGFECYKKNTLDQLFVNVANEQLQFHYNQKIFAWDRQTAEEEEIPLADLHFEDNKLLMDQILSKPNGLLSKIDEATRDENPCYLTESLRTSATSPIFVEGSQDFSINHYTGKLTYNAAEMPQKNKDFLPPELIDTMRLSGKDVVKQLFSFLLSKSGNLSLQSGVPTTRLQEQNSAILEKKKNKENRINTNVQGQYSQSRQMRTLATNFRSTCADLIKSLTVHECGLHFVRCLRTDLSNKPDGFHPEVVRQQLKALSVVNTILAMQQGYSYNASHIEFIRRYKFLAFDFDENVEETKDNCRLLLLRLKLEGWIMGKTKVFLKYFNKEYLSRLYEIQIKKIVKVQAMMRSFMARRKLYAKIKRYQADDDKFELGNVGGEEWIQRTQAAIIIQKKFREHVNSNQNESFSDSLTDGLTETQLTFIRPWFKRWKEKSIFQILLLYRAETLYTLVNFCLQIHVFNQNTVTSVQNVNEEVPLENIDSTVKPTTYLPPIKASVHKIYFSRDCLNLCAEINCEPLPECSLESLKSEVAALLQKKYDENRNEVIEPPEVHEEISKEENLKISEDKETQTHVEEVEQEPPIKKEVKIEKEGNALLEITSEPDVENNNYEKEGNALLEITSEPDVENKNYEKETIAVDENKNDVISVPPTPMEKCQQKENIQISKIESSLNKENENFRFNTFPSRIPSVKTQAKFKTPVSELEERFRQAGKGDENENPPFNFRALLRKTSYPSNSDINNIANFESERNKLVPEDRRFPLRRKSEIITTEIVPGILVYGQIADL